MKLTPQVTKAIKTAGILLMVTGGCALFAFDEVHAWSLDLTVLGLGVYVVGRMIEARNRL